MRTLSLLMLAFLYPAMLWAQTPARLSPSLSHEIKRGQSNQPWIITVTNIDSFRKNFKTDIIIQQEYRAVNSLRVLPQNSKAVQALISSNMLVFADLAQRKAKEELLVSGLDLGLNRVNRLHHFYPSLTGEGLMVSIKENRYDSADIDLKGRTVTSGFASSTSSPHATIMATITGGAGNSFYQGKGVAWKTGMQSASFANLMPEPDTYYITQHVRVQNHSYGTGLENYYGSDAAAYDALVAANRPLVHVFSAGNSGLANGTGPYTGIAGFSNLTGSFKMAKNIITAGSLDSLGNIEPASSRGPAYDGRIKPEVVAFGQDGSSGAAALVSGVSLLMQQAYRQNRPAAWPAAALVKAMLITTADDVGATGPDYASGFGSVNAYKAVQGMLRSAFFHDSVLQSAQKDINLSLPAGLRSLRLTLAWSDPPATANAAKALVHDLDLELVHTASGQTWKPWVLSSFPHKDSLQLTATRKRDTLNNVEYVSVENPPAGNYIVKVNGSRISNGYQEFFVAYAADTANRFEWTYPMPADAMEGGTSVRVRWDATYGPGTTGLLEYSLTNGNNWQTISTTADLSKKQLPWNTPDVFSKALLRMTIGTDVYVSDTFVISKPLSTQVGYNCADSFLFYWNRPAGISQFRLYVNGSSYLQPVTITSDTFYKGAANTVNSRQYTVVPLVSGREGIRSYTFDYATQGVGCYFKSFLPQLDNAQARLLVELGTLANINRLFVQKLSANGFVTIQTVSNLAALQFIFTDASLQQGINTYRIALQLNDGRTIYSSNEIVYYVPASSQYVIFPNPARAGGVFKILRQEVGEIRMVIQDAAGRKIKEDSYTDLLIGVNIAGVQKGLYIVSIWKADKRVYVEKLIVQ